MAMGNKGYTLVESIVAMAILGILFAIALPSFYSWSQSLKFKEAAWSLLGDLRTAKQLSVSTNLEHRVEVDIPSKRFRLTRGDRPSGSTAWSAVRPWRDLPATVRYASGEDCDNASAVEITFKPNGSAQSAVLCVKDPPSTVKYRINVNATSGRASIS